MIREQLVFLFFVPAYLSKLPLTREEQSRLGFRHILVALSPGGIRPMPFSVWLGFPEGFLL